MLDISECFWNLIIIIGVTCFAQVSNQQQHRQQPRNGVQQLLQAQQVSLSKVIAAAESSYKCRPGTGMSFSLERILQVLAAVQGIQHPHSSVDPLAASEQGDRPDEALLYQVIILGFLTEFY